MTSKTEKSFGFF